MCFRSHDFTTEHTEITETENNLLSLRVPRDLCGKFLWLQTRRAHPDFRATAEHRNTAQSLRARRGKERRIRAGADLVRSKLVVDVAGGAALFRLQLRRVSRARRRRNGAGINGREMDLRQRAAADLRLDCLRPAQWHAVVSREDSRFAGLPNRRLRPQHERTGRSKRSQSARRSYERRNAAKFGAGEHAA